MKAEGTELEMEALRTPGGVLAAARVRAGLSVAEVARRSRVPERALIALEADDWGQLSAMVYVRGFIRLFAKEVGIDPEEPIGLLDAIMDEGESREIAAHSHAEAELRAARWASVRWSAGYAIAAAALILAVLTALFSLDPTPLEARNLPADAAPHGVAP
jgi:cytoskeleton protein RodZ